MKRVVIALVLAGCDNLFGLSTTSLAPDGAPPPSDTPPPPPIDGCTEATCQVFTSCKALKESFPNATSGVYMIDAGTGPFPAYCEQTGDGGGWTLVLKVDGAQPTFAYDQAIWQDPTPLAANAPDFDHTQAKLESWNAVAFTEIRVALEFPINSGAVRSVVMPIGAPRLGDLFAATAPQNLTALGRDAWKGLIGPTASLQLECNQEGTNVGSANSRVRIGIVSNQEADCLTPDSRIGIGGADSAQCTFPTTETAGNSACFTPDNGEVEQVAFGWVMVR